MFHRRCAIQRAVCKSEELQWSAIRRAAAGAKDTSAKTKSARDNNQGTITEEVPAEPTVTPPLRVRMWHTARLVISSDDPATCQTMLTKTDILNTYDAVILEPLSDQVFAAACTTLDIDAITLDMSKRLPFRLRSSLIKAAVARGIYFEVWWQRNWLLSIIRRPLHS